MTTTAAQASWRPLPIEHRRLHWLFFSLLNSCLDADWTAVSEILMPGANSMTKTRNEAIVSA